jgi:hypothetical protein
MPIHSVFWEKKVLELGNLEILILSGMILQPIDLGFFLETKLPKGTMKRKQQMIHENLNLEK